MPSSTEATSSSSTEKSSDTPKQLSQTRAPFRGRIRYSRNRNTTTTLPSVKPDSRAIDSSSNDNLLPSRCESNEIFLECGPNCPETCEQGGVRRKRCKVRCRRGCFCQPGYIRHRRECIKKSECPGWFFQSEIKCIYWFIEFVSQQLYNAEAMKNINIVGIIAVNHAKQLENERRY